MTLLSLFSVGFIMGLTGAMAPGPLLTVTIGESARRGGIVGPLIVFGHGILEFALLALIIFGAANFLNNPKIFAGIALSGGVVLIYTGYAAIKRLKGYSLAVEPAAQKQGLHPVVAGIIISLSNPYWFIWWITIGMGYVMFARGLGIHGILAFFAGHILSDLAWYSFVSYGIQFGGKFLSIRIIKGGLLACSLFLVLFGVYFIVKGCSFISTNG
jgi:threonine/homoserine/homoserine lactone efflux protein